MTSSFVSFGLWARCITSENLLICLPAQTVTGMLCLPMAKEQFFYPETQSLFKKLEQLSQRSGVSRGQAFEDWFTAMVCYLAAETKEDEYLAMVERHKKGQPGKRGIDLMPQMFAELVNSMTQSKEDDADILGDLFQETPVPVLTQRLRDDAADLFDQKQDAEATTDLTLPTIMEIPHWLARLEPKLAALDSQDSPTVDDKIDEPESVPDDLAPEQKELVLIRIYSARY